MLDESTPLRRSAAFQSSSTSSTLNIRSSSSSSQQQQQQQQQQNLNRQRSSSASDVRVNALNTTSNEIRRRDRAADPKTIAIFSTLWHLPQVLAVVIVLGSASSWCECERPLGVWLSVSAFRMVFGTAWAWRTAFPGDTTPDRIKRVASIYKILSIIWLVVGNVWILNDEECQEKCPQVFDTVLALVVAQYFVMFLPCILLMIAVPLVCFCLPCLIRILQQSRGNTNSALNEDDLKKLDMEIYRKGMFGDDDEEEPRCAICLSDYEVGDSIRRLPCDGRHHFHKDCVDDWLRLNASCPNCRFRIGGDEESKDDSGSSSSSSDERNSNNNNISGNDQIEVRVDQI